MLPYLAFAAAVMSMYQFKSWYRNMLVMDESRPRPNLSKYSVFTHVLRQFGVGLIYSSITWLCYCSVLMFRSYSDAGFTLRMVETNINSNIHAYVNDAFYGCVHFTSVVFFYITGVLIACAVLQRVYRASECSSAQ